MNIGKYVEMFFRDMRVRKYSERTVENYASQVKLFLQYFEKVATKPSEISEEKIKNWLLTAKCVNSQNHMQCAVKLFYEITGKQPLKFRNIRFPKKEKRLPVVLSQDEVQRMFSVCQNIKHKVILALLYSAGLRVSDLLNLKWENIDRSRGVIYILQGKGNKDRIVPLADSLVPLLEKYLGSTKPKVLYWQGSLASNIQPKA